MLQPTKFKAGHQPQDRKAPDADKLLVVSDEVIE
jgi:hypothetical protein